MPPSEALCRGHAGLEFPELLGEVLIVLAVLLLLVRQFSLYSG